MSIVQLIGLSINISMFGLVLAIGLETTLKDATHLLRHPALLVRSLISINVIMVLVACAIIAVLKPAPEVALALGAIALSPVPPILPAKQKRAGGTQEYAIGLLCAAAVASVVLVPLGLTILNYFFDTQMHLSPGHDAGIVLLSVIVPLAVGIVIHQANPALAQRLVRPVSLLSGIVLVVGLLPVLFTETPIVFKLIGDGVLLGLIAFAVIGLAVGHWLGGPYSGDRTVLALATSTRHPGVAIAIASLNFPDLRATLAVVIFHLIVSAIIAGPYVKWRLRDVPAKTVAVK